MKNNFRDRFYTSIALFALVILIINSNFILVYSLIVIGILSIIEFINLINKIFIKKFIAYIFNLFFIIYIFSFCYMFFIFSNFLQIKMILYSLLFACIASDVGGYVIGKIIKGPKLTKLSPKKTISGSLGSIIFTVIIFSSLINFFTGSVSILIIIIAVIISLTCQLGDLFFSLLKRKAKVKDTGNFLPGHGGALDRIDGILFSIPIGFLSFVFLL